MKEKLKKRRKRNAKQKERQKEKKDKKNGDLIFLYSKGRRGRNEAFHPSVRRVIHPVIRLVIHPNKTNIYFKKGKKCTHFPPPPSTFSYI
jgi:hypothetical protein